MSEHNEVERVWAPYPLLEERRGPGGFIARRASGAGGFGYFCQDKSDPLKAEAFDLAGQPLLQKDHLGPVWEVNLTPIVGPR